MKYEKTYAGAGAADGAGKPLLAELLNVN